MSADRRQPGRAPRRYAQPSSPLDLRASRTSRYPARPRQSTSAVTTKLTLLAVVAALAIGGLIATQMAAGNDPALGPKAAARAKKALSSSSDTGSSASTGASPYGQGYGADGYYYDYGTGGYSSGSSGSSSGSSGYSYSAPPVTSSTS